MKKERLFYLDFIRAFATVVIVITHYNAIFLYLPTPTPEKAFLTTEVANIYIGSFGVSLFFIISGAALMYVYQDELNYKQFYKKRFVSLFPMFWMVFFIDFLVNAYLRGGINPAIPKWKIIYSVVGMDHYLSEYTVSYARIGEWFLGCIILIYLLFPLIKKGVDNKPIITAIVLLVLYVVAIVFDQGNFALGKNIFVRLPEFVFGMYFVKYFKKVHVAAFGISLCILMFNTVCKPGFIHNSVQTTYVGVGSFCVLVFISKHLDCQPMRYLSGVISKYSYAVFLVHHVIILELVAKVDLINITRTNSYLLFMLCGLCVALVSRWVYKLHGDMMNCIQQMFKNNSNK